MRKFALTAEDVEREVAALDALDVPALQKRWHQLFGHAPPPRIRARLLRQAVAYKIQVQAFGGLKPKTIRRLRALAAELREKRNSASGAAVSSLTARVPTLSPGTQLIREWRGKREVVEVTSDGFVWSDRCFTTLSAVATAITGTKWSGPRFFGLGQGGGK